MTQMIQNLIRIKGLKLFTLFFILGMMFILYRLWSDSLKPFGPFMMVVGGIIIIIIGLWFLYSALQLKSWILRALWFISTIMLFLWGMQFPESDPATMSDETTLSMFLGAVQVCFFFIATFQYAAVVKRMKKGTTSQSRS